MAATIQTIQKPTRARALDTSGNNNHGQIYSGRALEFDGVTDYLSCGNSENFITGNNVTFACWVKRDSDARGYLVHNSRSGTSSNFSVQLSAESTTNDSTTYGKIEMLLWNGSTLGYATTDGQILEKDTWYRIVCTTTASVQQIYVNGVAATMESGQSGHTFANDAHATADMGIGAIASGALYKFSGHLSDWQLWNATWDADDVLYDYLNPEQLALNNGGTSLINSNLVLWYPMNDGHRGNQSYVLDASNTGLGDELLSNGDFSNGLTGFTERDIDAGESAELSTEQVHSGSHSAKIVTLDNSSGLMTSTVLVAGQTYKVSAWFYVVDGNAFLNPSDSYALHTSYKWTTTTGEWEYLEFYFTATASTTSGLWLFLTDGTDDTSTFYVDDISVKPVNYKNNATTVFFGDEQISSTNDRTFAGANNWANAADDNAFDEYDESGSGVLTVEAADDGSNRQYCTLDGANWEDSDTMIVGRTYRLQYQLIISSYTKGTLSVGFSNDSYALQDVSAYDASQTVQTETLDFVYDGTSTQTKIIVEAAVSTVFTAIFDNFSLKEVGTATGWTDADQQLDIPQTALQSYNQLGCNFISSSASHPITTANYSPDFGTDSFVVSFSIFPNEVHTSDGRFMYQAETGSEGRFVFYMDDSKDLMIFVDSSTGDDVGYADITGTIIEPGQWHHIITVFNRSANTVTAYVNGEAQSQSVDISGATGTINGGGAFYPYSFDTTNNFIGCITEIAYWKDTTFSDSDAEELYNSGLILDATKHSKSSTLINYWRNNGLSDWEDLVGSTNLTSNTMTETMLITAGVDSSRDSQGFLMNRQRETSSLNLFKQDGNDESSPYAIIKENPLYTGSVVPEWSFSLWVRFNRLPSDTGEDAALLDAFPGTNAIAAFYIRIDSNNVFYVSTYSDASGTTKTEGKDLDVDVGGVGYDASEEWKIGKWIHLAGTFKQLASDTTLWIYANGKQIDGSDTKYTDPFSMQADCSSPIGIGINVSSAAGAVAGTVKGDFILDDVCLYSKYLDANEVLRNYNAGKRSHR